MEAFFFKTDPQWLLPPRKLERGSEKEVKSARAVVLRLCCGFSNGTPMSYLSKTLEKTQQTALEKITGQGRGVVFGDGVKPGSTLKAKR